MNKSSFSNLDTLAEYLRQELENKKFILLYAYNGTGKTRLSTDFKDFGKRENTRGDTLYFNAFTEDLFSWDNDLENDKERFLKINSSSKFFAGLEEFEMDTRIRLLLQRYTDFDFKLDTIVIKDKDGNFTQNQQIVRFYREILSENKTIAIENIKVSRGEENIFIWCFFLAVVQLALGGAGAYKWVKYIYIDDPISSLDEHNAIAVANHLAQLLKQSENQIKTVISTHHTLFFNVVSNEIKDESRTKKASQFFLGHDKQSGIYVLREQKGDTPFFHHVAALVHLYEAEQSGKLYTHHFNMLRSILEKTASFHGYRHFSACIKRDPSDLDGILYTRIINILSHGNYSLYEPQEMLEENKRYFRNILHDFIERYSFNPSLFPKEPEAEQTP
jgi:wobble nucleotide-excising tRNase